jgi:hypothetical protein
VNIIFGEHNLSSVKEKNSVLELDTFRLHDSEVMTAYCLLTIEDIPLAELPEVDNHIKLHTEFVKAYKRGEKDFCSTIGTILKSKFNGALVEFYDNAISRLNSSEKSWDYIINKS